ncbi:uncharacterized protein LY89DRAFT_681357 [Mollisia scopiformis]|uniref:Uncharacterized protein n=1 Tax=Mollisia scopiformis TaxID=149040 RepID=A0A194XPL8_MOLSC|nr:uncharacterized protein LY89DRAFT_681357 [Mollisia scopiformis]KUJ22019.1 hypothetical protein LY89DRAFT_681357 [Mollisia scopiformis]
MSAVATPIFCCGAASPVVTASSRKLHYDPNRELHETIFRSFIAFAIRQHQEADRQEKASIQAQELLQLLMSALNPDSRLSTPQSFDSTPVSRSPVSGAMFAPTPPFQQSGLVSALATTQQQAPPAPVLTEEALKDNPLASNPPYAIHLTSRHDFGPVYSHRYFVCPDDLSHDWVEASQAQWFAKGADFTMKAEKWDLKCTKDSRFFRLTLRPNLRLRGCYSAPTRTTAAKHVAYQVVGNRTGVYEGDQAAYPIVDNGSGVLGGHAAYPMAGNGTGVPEEAQAAYLMAGNGTGFHNRGYVAYSMIGSRAGFLGGGVVMPQPVSNLDMEQASSSAVECGGEDVLYDNVKRYW